ncbi:cytoplasmic linker protein 190 [Striga asiatica]|uniref:Cytoplasmic linker protein 190 n=1 Tax=Striga asiatica TaxID=4170 RepID=A0A5A7QHJ1_STRAF|nr:cytoplasmic linker protein 190 [Striga asiatica]
MQHNFKSGTAYFHCLIEPLIFVRLTPLFTFPMFSSKTSGRNWSSICIRPHTRISLSSSVNEASRALKRPPGASAENCKPVRTRVPATSSFEDEPKGDLEDIIISCGKKGIRELSPPTKFVG